MTTPTIDQAVLDELKVTTGAEFAMELVDTFLEEAPIMLQDLEASMAASDADRFRRAAHSLKSNSNTFGATALATEARRLELAGLASVIAGGAQPLAPLNAEYVRVAAALQALRDA
ncbi:MAG: Hpt domain-containing protein [Betaproteobacteria bacterium]